jgi:hypothetical protein
MLSTSDEQSLVEQARHDPQAFATLYDRFVGPISLFALRRTGDRVLAEDITSATFEKALRHLRQYGWKARSYLAWLYRIAYQQMIHHHRRNHRFVALLPDQPADIDVEQQAQSSLQWRAIVQASRRPRIEPLGGSGLPPSSRQQEGNQTAPPVSPASRSGFSDWLAGNYHSCRVIRAPCWPVITTGRYVFIVNTWPQAYLRPLSQ